MLEVLANRAVDLLVIGGVAATIHGSDFPPARLDVLYALDDLNCSRMLGALTDLKSVPRDGPINPLDTTTLMAGPRFNFETKFGPVDIFGEAAGMRRYEKMRADATQEKLWGIQVRVASIDDLIRMKRAAGRPKDTAMAEELIAIAEAQRRAAKGEKEASS